MTSDTLLVAGSSSSTFSRHLVFFAKVFVNFEDFT